MSSERASGLTARNLRVTFGVVATLAWLAFVGWYIATQVGFGNIIQFQPNELGEFMTGCFVPPALLWLVIGFFHQWGRVADNTRILSAQSTELARIGGEVSRQSTAIAKHELQVSRDTFMRMAEVYLAEMTALAADMLAKVDANLVEAAWNRQSMGDKQAVFRDAIDCIREYRDAFIVGDSDDGKPSEVVNRYLWVAEELMHGAYRCDEEIGRYYEFSPAGTLYAALCHLVRREGRFKLRSPIVSIEDMRW